MSRIDKRVVFTAVVGLALVSQVALAGVAFFARRVTDGDLQAQRAQHEQLCLQAEQRAAASTDEPAEQPSPATSAAPTWRLLDGPDVVTTLQVLQEVGDAAGVSFDSQKATRSSNEGKQPFTIAGRGTPEQVCAFVAGIERHEHLMIVETGRVLPASDTQIAFEFGVATYHGGAR